MKFKIKNSTTQCFLISLIILCSAFTVNAEPLTLDETCTVSILNRSVQVASDGNWQLDNVPSFMGQVRARATCLREGGTEFGQTGFFNVVQNGNIQVGNFETVEAEEVPVSLEFATGNNTILYGNQTFFRLKVFANYADGSREDITGLSSGVNYSISNNEIAQIDFNGVLQGLSSGTVIITARKDGTSAAISVTIVTTGDSDGDGLPDDFEQANGLNANDPIDAFEDRDGDGLSAIDEYLAGTDINVSDTDNDGISDGEELAIGENGFITNPLLSDSDSDGINDGLEVLVGTDPNDIEDYNLASSISSLDIDPESVVITFNSIQGADASAQLTVLGTTLDGETIDITRTSRGTNYVTSDPTICNFGGQAGEVFAGENGSCVVTADNSGLSDTSDIEVRSFDPAPLNYLSLDDQAHNVDVEGSYAYIATDDGLTIVDVSDPMAPFFVSSLSLGTDVRDVKVQGDVAYLTTDTVALVVVDVTDRLNPDPIATYGAAIAGKDLALYRNQIFIATGTDGLLVINVASPAFPQRVNSLNSNSSIIAVAVSPSGDLVGVIDNTQLRLLQLDTNGFLLELGAVGLSRPTDLLIDNNVAYVADLSRSLTLVSLLDPSAPAITGSTPAANSGWPNDLVLAGNFALLADTAFPNAIPLIDVRDINNPSPRGLIDFSTLGFGGGDGYGIDADNQYAYVVTGQGLQIGQYQQFVDENMIPPEVSIITPTFGDAALEGGIIRITAEASDDIAVQSVSFFVDAELIYTDVVAPFEFELPLPVASSLAMISVMALDYGGNTSELDSVPLTLLADSDYDGLSDDDELLIHGTSPYAADTDGDGLSDATEIALGYDPLDADMDNDNLLDGEEVNPGEDGFITNPYDPDSDNDGMNDGFESRFGLNPLDASDANIDSDEDGLTNLEEYRRGFDPTSADSDSDGMPDEYERRYGLDPLNPEDFFGDLDDDGVPNGVEYNEGTDPTNPDVIGPQVALLMPEDGTALPANSSLLVRFNEKVKIDNLDEISATMVSVSTAMVVEGIISISTDGFILSFNPVLNLDVSEEYTFSLSGVRDVAGNPMAVVYSDTITTTELADNIGPVVLARSPFNRSERVAVNTLITLDFDETIDPTVLNEANFYLYDNRLRTKVAGGIGISEDGLQLYFIPDQALLVGREYYLYATNIKDMSGNNCSNCSSYRYTYFDTAFSTDELAPVVVSSTVSDGSIDVPQNARFIIKLDESIGPLFNNNVSLVSNEMFFDTNVTVSNDRKLVTITPLTLLTSGADFVLTVDGVTDLSGNSAENYSATFSVGDSADSTVGAVTAWSISSTATDVPLNALIEITLSERVDPTSINLSNSSFYLYDNSENRRVSGEWSLADSGNILRFIPDELLEADHQYFLYVSYGQFLLDLAGNRIGNYNYIYFDTSTGIDETAPSILLSNLAADSIDVPVNARVILLLDEPIGDACLPTVTLQTNGASIAANVSIANDRKTLTLLPDNALLTSTLYTVRVDNLCDYSGNALNGEVLSFTTSSNEEEDTTPPNFTNVIPVNNSLDVLVNTSIVFEFDEVIDRQTAPVISGGGVEVLGEYQVDGNTLTFTPDAPLQGGITYSANYWALIYDLAGNYQYVRSYSFTTEALIDETAPTVSTVSPVGSAVDVNPGTSLWLTFSEPMNSSTVNNNNIALYVNGTVIRPSIYRSSDGQRVSLTATLPTESVVSIVVTDGVEDLSGNPVTPFVSSFTTGIVDRDTSRPSVTRQIPSNNTRDWFDLDEVVLYINEPLDAASIDGAFYVAQNGVLVDGIIEVLADNQSIRFTANTFFTEGALVQVYLESLATDDSGNAVYDYSGYFYMGSRDELVGTRAVPTAYSPFSGQTEVPLNPTLMVSYSEALDPAGLNSAVIELWNRTDNLIVPSDVSLDDTGYLLEVAPQSLLLANKQYELRLDNIIDTDGDTNTSLYRPRFTTGESAVEDDRQPITLSQSPPQGAVDVGVNAKFAVRYDERINPLSFDTDNGQRYSALFSENNRVVQYQRIGTLAASSEITENTPSVMDLAGNIVVDVSATFTTSTGPDFIVPTAKGSITNGATDIATNAVVAWEFSEAIDPVSVSTSGVFLYDNQLRVRIATAANLSVDGKRIDLIPESPLLVGRQYRYYRNGLRDLSGNLAGNTNWYFTTAFAEDTTAPQVLDSTVSDGQVDVPTNVRLNVRFDEALSQLTASRVSLIDAGGAAIAHTVTLNSNHTMLTVVPTQILQANAVYTFTVDGVEDISGNGLTESFEVEFETKDTADFTGGLISDWSFINAETNVSLTALISATMSERLDPTSINNNSLYLNNSDGVRVGGGWSLEEGVVLTFSPSEPLLANKRYYLYVSYSPYLKDLSGNNIVINQHRYFTTESGD